MLTKGDDFPIHQLPVPISEVGTERNFYDRYFFNGYSKKENFCIKNTSRCGGFEQMPPRKMSKPCPGDPVGSTLGMLGDRHWGPRRVVMLL